MSDFDVGIGYSGRVRLSFVLSKMNKFCLKSLYKYKEKL